MLIWNGLKKRAGRILAAVGALTAGGCATPEVAAAEVQPKPALWKLADADTTIYLFGTIHLLPKGLDWRTPALDQAIAQSGELYLETVIDKDAIESAKAVKTLGMAEGLPPLVERVPEEKRAALAERIATLGLKPGQLDRFETWAAAMTLLSASFKELGLESELGVERALEARYANKKVSGLETVGQQFGFLDGLSEEGQRLFLEGVLDDPADARANFADMLKAWAAGDVEGIAANFDAETALSPELREVLMTRRNATWAEWLAKRLDQPGTLMVAVGAGHLAGKDSVQAMLAGKGLTVERVQ